jgi:hypothetical protein
MWHQGDHWNICDECGRKRLASDTRKRWDNVIVCSDTCWEPRHPQDLIRGVPDNPAVQDARPRVADVFLFPGEVNSTSLTTNQPTLDLDFTTGTLP